MPIPITVTLDRIGNKPVLSSRCISGLGGDPVIDLSKGVCKIDAPQFIKFNIKPTADYAFVYKEAYAFDPAVDKPKLWNFGKEIIPGKSEILVFYDNKSDIWFNLKFTDGRANNAITMFDPKIKSGQTIEWWTDPYVLLGIAALIAGVAFWVGRKFGLRQAAEKP